MQIEDMGKNCYSMFSLSKKYFLSKLTKSFYWYTISQIIIQPYIWCLTLSEIQFERRKTKPVTMQANFIHTWSVEYEFITKNQFNNWTSKLARIWHIFRKLGYFWLFLSAPVQAASGDFVLVTRCYLYWSTQKEPNFL